MERQRNQSENHHVLNIRAGLITAKTKYSSTIEENDYLDIAVDFLRDVNEYSTSDYYALLRSDFKGNVRIPCNVQVIDAVMDHRLGLHKFGDRILYTNDNPLAVEVDTTSYINREEVFNGRFREQTGDHSSVDRLGEGHIIYRFVDDRTLSVKLPDIDILVAYQGVTVDEEDFPLITRKQSNGIAAAVFYNRTLFKAMAGNQIAGTLLQFAKEEAGRLKQAASIPEYINDNEIDEILNAKTSFNRKSYRRPSKHSR